MNLYTIACDTEAASRLEELLDEHKTQAAVARHLGINQGLVSVAIRGQYSPTVRHALGLPPMVPVVPCAACGEVHTQYKTCDKKRKTPDRTRFSGDTPLAADIAAEARRLGLTNGEMLKTLWICYLLQNENGPEGEL